MARWVVDPSGFTWPGLARHCLQFFLGSERRESPGAAFAGEGLQCAWLQQGGGLYSTPDHVNVAVTGHQFYRSVETVPGIGAVRLLDGCF